MTRWTGEGEEREVEDRYNIEQEEDLHSRKIINARP